VRKRGGLVGDSGGGSATNTAAATTTTITTTTTTNPPPSPHREAEMATYVTLMATLDPLLPSLPREDKEMGDVSEERGLLMHAQGEEEEEEEEEEG